MTVDLPDDFRIERPPKDFYQFLLVDDEPVARNLLRVILQTNGYSSVSEASSGDEALEALTAQEYHVVLLDKNMPGIDGLVVLRQGRGLRPECEFIMITAYGSLDTAVQAMDLGAYSYVTKPFVKIDEFLRRVEGALERVWIRLENALLLDRLRMLLAELDHAERELSQSRTLVSDQAKTEIEQIRMHEAISRLQQLASKLEFLRVNANGTAQVMIQRLETEASEVVTLLSGDKTSPRKAHP